MLELSAREAQKVAFEALVVQKQKNFAVQRVLLPDRVMLLLQQHSMVESARDKDSSLYTEVTIKKI